MKFGHDCLTQKIELLIDPLDEGANWHIEQLQGIPQRTLLIRLLDKNPSQRSRRRRCEYRFGAQLYIILNFLRFSLRDGDYVCVMFEVFSVEPLSLAGFAKDAQLRP